MKKKIPLDILKIVEPILLANSELIKKEEPGERLYFARDAEEGSSFCFQVIKTHVNQDGKLVVELDYSPANALILNSQRVKVYPDQLELHLKNWIEILKGYQTILSIYDDPVLRSYEQFYAEGLKMEDADADYTPFNPVKQLQIDEGLEFYLKLLDEHKTDKNKETIEEIKGEIDELRENQSLLSKNRVVRRLAKIYAKITKAGIPVLKDMLNKGKDELIKEAVKWGMKLIIE